MPVRVQIDGVGTVELDDAFRTKTSAEQNTIIEGVKRSAPRQGLAHNVVRGANVGVADVFGAPADLTAGVLNAGARLFSGSEEPWIKSPVGGSQSIRSLMNAPGEMLGTGETAAAYRDISEVTPSHRPFAVASETFAGSAVPGLGGFAALRGAKNVPAALKPMAEFAKQSPRAFVSAELAGASGSAQGSGIAEMIAPENPAARFVGEVAGGFLSPSSLMQRAYRRLSAAGKTAAGAVLPSFTRKGIGPLRGSEDEAAAIVQRVVRDAGEDPAALSRALFTADPDNLKLTSGQHAGSKALLNLEAKLAESRPGVAAMAETRQADALGQLRETADVLGATKNPGALRAAAALRKRYFDDLMQARINTALQDAQDARQGITRGGGTTSAMEASSDAVGALERAYDEARGIERQMWSVVPSDRPANVTNIMKTYQRARGELLPNDRLREPIEGYLRILSGETPETVSIEYPDGTVKSIGGKGYQPTTGDLKNLRSRALSLERQAAQQGDRTTERHMGMLARSALEDLSEMKLPGLDAARQYSSSMHDAFTKTFADDVLSVTREGADRIPPQLALERAYGAGGAGANVRLQQLQSASSFPESVRAETAPTMAGAQERFLRSQVGRMAHPETGAFDPNQLQRFESENRPTLTRFPELRGEVESLAGAERGLARVRAVAGSRQERVSKVLGSVLRTEDPVRTVRDTLRGRNPVRDYTALANVARKGGGAEAISGLRSATIRHAIDSATPQNGALSFERLNDALTGPVGSGRESLLDVMTRSGTVTRDQLDKLRTLVDRGAALERASGDARLVSQLFRTPDAALDLAARIIGARVGAKLASGPGSVLIGAARGSRTARDIMQKIPMSRVSDVLVEAVENPKLMSALLAKPRTPGEQRAIGQIIHGFLINAGLTGAAEDRRRGEYAQ